MRGGYTSRTTPGRQLRNRHRRQHRYSQLRTAQQTRQPGSPDPVILRNRGDRGPRASDDARVPMTDGVTANHDVRLPTCRRRIADMDAGWQRKLTRDTAFESVTWQSSLKWVTSNYTRRTSSNTPSSTIRQAQRNIHEHCSGAWHTFQYPAASGTARCRSSSTTYSLARQGRRPAGVIRHDLKNSTSCLPPARNPNPFGMVTTQAPGFVDNEGSGRPITAGLGQLLRRQSDTSVSGGRRQRRLTKYNAMKPRCEGLRTICRSGQHVFARVRLRTVFAAAPAESWRQSAPSGG